MKILITGICGFVGTSLAQALHAHRDSPTLEISGIDNLSRPGSEFNRRHLKELGVRVHHGDVRMASDLEIPGAVDWVIDAAANPRVSAGVDGKTSSRQLIEHNLLGTINLLEHCRKTNAGFVLLSTSRVYSIPPLAGLPVEIVNDAFRPTFECIALRGLTAEGVGEEFSTTPPISLYGATKVASECLAVEYHHTFQMPVWVNRCGVLAGAGQFGNPDQGIFSYWINAHLRKKPLRYIGFAGHGFQVRDCLHPRDLAELLLKQIDIPGSDPRERVVNVSGGSHNSISLAQLTRWCDDRFSPHPVSSDPVPRAFDVPWLVLDSAKSAKIWDWAPRTRLLDTFNEIADHAEKNPDWLEISSVS